MFDVSLFLQTSTEEVGDTVRTPIPEGRRIFTIDKIKPGGKEGVDGNEPSYWLDLVFKTSDAEVIEATGQKEPAIFKRVFLDVTPSAGLDMSKGKNVELNQIRDALGQNRPGMKWMPAMMLSCPLQVETKNKNDEATGQIRTNPVRYLAVGAA